MVWRVAELQAIRAGRIDLAFRRWERPRLRAGTQMRTAVGLVEVIAVAAGRAGEDQRAPGAPGGRPAPATSSSPASPSIPSGRSFASPCATPGPTRASPCASAPSSPTPSAPSSPRAWIASTGPRPRGPWTRTTLAAIADRPATRAPDLAAQLGRETAPFKRDVRKLKELGLTESLEVGYRLSPRGRALLDGLAADP